MPRPKKNVDTVETNEKKASRKTVVPTEDKPKRAVKTSKIDVVDTVAVEKAKRGRKSSVVSEPIGEPVAPKKRGRKSSSENDKAPEDAPKKRARKPKTDIENESVEAIEPPKPSREHGPVKMDKANKPVKNLPSSDYGSGVRCTNNDGEVYVISQNPLTITFTLWKVAQDGYWKIATAKSPYDLYPLCGSGFEE